MGINDMTIEEFKSLPCRGWNEEIGIIDSLIIMPEGVSSASLLKYKVRDWLSRHISWLKKPEVYEVDGMHDSGYRCMDFVAVKDDKPICRLSGCSDVIHIEGIGGFGYDWLNKYGSCPKLVPHSGWSIDCLATSGLLRMFVGDGIRVGRALSSFEIYSVKKANK